MPLRVRLAVLVAVAVTVLLGAGGLFFTRQLQAGLDDATDTALRARADALVQQVGPDANPGFQDAGAAGLLAPNEALAQVVDGAGALAESSEGAAGRPLLSGSQLTAARQAPVNLTSLDAGGGSVRLLAVPVDGSGKPPTVVVVGTSRALTEQAVTRVRTGLLIGGPVAVLTSTWGAWLLAGAVLRPVERMRRQAEDITAGDPSARLSVPTTRDEVAALGATMNDLLRRLQHALAQQRDLVADAGHELRTPLTLLRAELELAGRPGRSRADLSAAVNRAAGDTDRLIRLAEDLLLLARTDEPDTWLAPAPVRLDTLAADAVRSRATTGDAGVHFQVEAPAPVTVTADADRLRQVLDNLLDNAIRNTPPEGTVAVRVTQAEASTEALLDVEDTGPGFPLQFLPHAFERFRRADPARAASQEGAGLGLAIVASLVHAHGGTVTAENLPGSGARVRVHLPTGAPPIEPRVRV